jgi:hypothetical protein
MSDDLRFEQLIGHPVLDAAGGSLGVLTSLFADVDTGQIVFGGITMIRRGRRRIVFVPLASAHVSGQTITLRCGGQLVRRAPNVQPGRRLHADDERGLYDHYEMPYSPVATGRRRLLQAAE